MIKRVASKLGGSWPELALYLSFDIEECQAIKGAFPRNREQAGQMLAHWRKKFSGDNPVEYLTRALMAMDLDLTQEIGKDYYVCLKIIVYVWDRFCPAMLWVRILSHVDLFRIHSIESIK